MSNNLWVIINVIIDDSRNYYNQLETDLFHEINACKRRLQQRQNELQRQIMKAKVFIIPTTNPKPNWNRTPVSRTIKLLETYLNYNLNGSPWTWSFMIVQDRSFTSKSYYWNHLTPIREFWTKNPIPENWASVFLDEKFRLCSRMWSGFYP